ncbi:Cathepsin B [Gryllus bimaculatus]|nr:Cathepsin B [Gryllus bimaculatus]
MAAAASAPARRKGVAEKALPENKNAQGSKALTRRLRFTNETELTDQVSANLFLPCSIALKMGITLPGAWLALGAVLLALAAVALVEGADYSDLRGDYCARSRGDRKCCRDRRDDCSVPILGTLCYCDEFCNRTRNEDCCPDYWAHCLGMEPPPQLVFGCRHEGRDLRINCNLCTCSVAGGAGPEVLCETAACLVEPEVIRGVNARHDAGAIGWRAGNHSAFWGRRLDEGLSLRLGTLQPQRTVRRMRPIRRWENHGSRIPSHFDARRRWQGRITPVRDQGWCGASWALSTAAVASDRFAIMSAGEEHPALAPMHLLACNTRGQRGCGGGYLDRAVH